MNKSMKNTLAVVSILMLAGFQAQAAETYILTITNGSQMPLSPAAVYVKNGQVPNARIGLAPTNGFVQLCQTGNPTTRVQELSMDGNVTYKMQTTTPILPGESRTLEITVQDPLTQSVQLETMYGKTKDVCALISVGSHSLYALKQHVTSTVLGKDEVVQTGAFLDPQIPMGRTYLDANVCQGQMDAISCLRSLALPNPGMRQIRYFSSYLSSLTMLLETKYGAAQALSLLLPTSGAVQYQLSLKH